MLILCTIFSEQCFPCLETLVKPGMYLIKLASAVPLSHKSPSLSTFPNTSFKLHVLSMDETAETSFNDLEFHPIEFCYLFLSAFLLKKKKKRNRKRASFSNFLLILTKFYIINLLYRILHFFLFVEIIQHTYPEYNFLLFSL